MSNEQPTNSTTFAPPGAGMWELDRSHFPGGTTTMLQWLMQGATNGMRQLFKVFGMPAETSTWLS